MDHNKEEEVHKEPGFDKIDIKKIFKDKNPGLARLIPGFIFNYLKRVIHEDELNEFMGKYGNLRGIDLVKAGLSYMDIKYQVHNKHNIPSEGRYLFVSNHPLGGLDGLVFMTEISKYFDDIKFPVNDILMNIDNMSGVFLPINKHGSQARESAMKIEEAYASDSQILYFPAGLCSRKKRGKVRDLKWQKNFIIKAKKHKRDIVPLYFSGHNSNWFYNLSNFRNAIGIDANIEMLYLPDEMFRQTGKELHIVFGESISWRTFDHSKTPLEWAEWVKGKSYELADVIK
ncbi:MAG TPA: 1-acyl-sn-glycerol-3-phosphate acyltransferase [Bacteroidales bacterium]|nr:1-acyl-sn-glycerol-3-phosphate acyltransferase [Bacteroidales bacterium]